MRLQLDPSRVTPPFRRKRPLLRAELEPPCARGRSGCTRGTLAHAAIAGSRELIFGAGKLDRVVPDVESLVRDWRTKEMDFGQLYLEYEPITSPDRVLSKTSLSRCWSTHGSMRGRRWACFGMARRSI
jgi:hypothetical protein